MNRNTFFRLPNRQRGVSLPVALILLVPLTLLGLTLANRNNLEELMASAQRDGQQALMNAETGLAMGHQALEKLVLDQVAAQRVNPSFGLSVGDVLILGDPVSYGGTALSNFSLARGDVTVVVLDNDDGDNDLTVDTDGRVILRSTGNYLVGERMVEAIVHMNFTSDPSNSSLPPLTIFTEEYLKVNGNPELFGPDALVHTNAYYEMSGTTYIAGVLQQVAGGTGAQYQQAVDGVWGNWSTERVTTGATRIQTPYVYPPVYKGMATRYFTADCQVWDGAPGFTNPLTGNASRYLGSAYGSEYEGWICDRDGSKNKQWELKTTTISNFFYVEGNVKIPSEIGKPNDPQSVSVVAEGWIEVSGNPYMEPYYATQGDFNNAASVDALADIELDGNPTYQGVNALDAVLMSDEILLLAGGDLKINGNPSTAYNFSGVMAAHDHMTISGNPRISGAIIAENAKYSSDSYFKDNISSGEWKIDLLTMNEISGNPQIYGSADLSGGGEAGTGDPVGANLQGWREAIE